MRFRCLAPVKTTFDNTSFRKLCSCGRNSHRECDFRNSAHSLSSRLGDDDAVVGRQFEWTRQSFPFERKSPRKQLEMKKSHFFEVAHFFEGLTWLMHNIGALECITQRIHTNQELRRLANNHRLGKKSWNTTKKNSKTRGPNPTCFSPIERASQGEADDTIAVSSKSTRLQKKGIYHFGRIFHLATDVTAKLFAQQISEK